MKAAIAALVLIGALYYLFNIPTHSGFNPSDDGMVVAQSYRIINGEIPHRDFISLRPVLSGYIHTLDFMLPFSIFENGRILMMAELFLAALFWAVMLSRFWSGLLFPLIIFAFVLNLNTFMPYPWTTTDGTAIAGIGAATFISAFCLSHNGTKKILQMGIGMVFLTASALCKQNFAPLPFLAILFAFISPDTRRKTPLIALIGFMPVFVYFFYFATNNALPDLIQQMSGRTALAAPGIMGYLTAFYKGRFFIVHTIVMLLIITILFHKEKSGFTIEKINTVHIVLSFLFAFTVLFGSFYLFQERDYFAIPFELFFILLFYSVWSFVAGFIKWKELSIPFFALSIGWCASISGGMNSPLLASGYLSSSFIIIFFISTKELLGKLGINNAGKAIRIFMAAIAIVLLLFSIYGKREFNYRDKPSAELDFPLSKISKKAFGRIQTNATTGRYIATVDSTIKAHPYMRDRAVFLPHHCAFYPAFDTKNPFPLDWNDRWEYLGMEEEYHTRCKKAADLSPVYLFVDKINTEVMVDTIVPMMYKPWWHENILRFINSSVKMPLENDFFDVYIF